MRSHLYLLPLAALSPTAVHATTFMSVAQEQARMFPAQVLRDESRRLTADQISVIRRDSGESPLSKNLKAWRSADGGWFIVDEVVGKHEFITLALALDVRGAVKDLDILDYREAYGGQVREAAWRAQFFGKRNGAPLRLGRDIRNISGATLSSKHVADGVRRLLATYAAVLAPSDH
jgi:hypothetical protein